MYYINYERDRIYGLYVFLLKMCNDIKLLIRFIYIGMRKWKLMYICLLIKKIFGYI